MRLRCTISILCLWSLVGVGSLRLKAQTVPPKAPPSLSVDRDPVPSPDPDEEPGLPVISGPPGTVNKGADGRYTLETEATEVRLPASVVDENGHMVQTLGRDAFQVYEDGVPQKITNVSHEDTPVSIGLLIDSSASMFDKREAVEDAALELVRLSNPHDQEFLVDFSARPYIDVGFTRSVERLKHALTYVTTSGGTAAYDAMVASADYLQKSAQNQKKVLVVITDGEDTASRTTLAQAIRRIQELDGPTIYCVGLLFGEDTDKREAQRSRQVLERIAQETGGVAFFPKSLKDVNDVAAEVAADIRTQYTIAYHSTNPPSAGGYRHLRVTASAKGYKKLDVRTRKGYTPKAEQTPAPAAKSAPTKTLMSPEPNH